MLPRFVLLDTSFVVVWFCIAAHAQLLITSQTFYGALARSFI